MEMSRMRICFAVLASLATIAQSTEWVPGQTYFQGDTVELDWSTWMLVAPTNAGWEQLPPYSASLSAVWQPGSIDTCARAWKSGGAYVQNQVVLDSGRLWRLELPSNAGWENWRPQSAFLWAVWSDAGPWEDYGGCLSPSDRDSDGVPDIVGAILETNGDISLFGHPDRWFVDDSNRTVVYDFSSVPGYEGSDSVQLVLPPPIDPPTPSFLKPVPVFSIATASQRNLPRVPEGYHFIGPEIRISLLNGTDSQARLVPIPLPGRVRNASLSDVLAFVHEGDTVWHSVPVLYFGGKKAIVRVYGTTAIRFAVKEKDVVWSPGYEQTNVMAWALNPGMSPSELKEALPNSPTFISAGHFRANLEIHGEILSQDWMNKVGYYRDAVIRPAIEHAARIGVNTIDLTFYNDSAHHNASNCSLGNSRNCRTYVNYLAFSQWVKEIERHNLESSGSMLRIRARIHPMFVRIIEFYEFFNRYAYLSDSSTHCDVPAQIDLDSLMSWHSHIARSLGEYNINADAYLNLQDPLIVRMMRAFFCISLEELQDVTGPEVEIDDVSLSLDNGGETGLSYLEIDSAKLIARPNTNDTLKYAILTFPSKTDTGDAFPVQWWLDYINHIDDILSFLRHRGEILREVYTDFATAVRNTIPLFSAKEHLIPAIFYQDWVGDALIRGTLFGYNLVRQTGIRLYHHTMYPVPFEMQRATQAFTIGIRNAVNLCVKYDSAMNFDTEMSWAHWDRRIITNAAARSASLGDVAGIDIWWKREFLTAENAQNFRDQADAAIRADAAGYVLCNWSIQDVLDGSNNKADLFDSTKTKWRRILGDADDEHIYGEGGVISVGPDTIQRRIAVYISDPVALLTQLSGDWMGMLYGTGNWYDSPGGLFGKLMRFCDERCEIAVVNDAMILDTEGAILDLYDEIWTAYPDTNSRPGIRDSCIARTERGEAFGYLRAHFAPKPAPPFPAELYPPTF